MWGGGSEYNLWTEDEISGNNSFGVIDYLPLSVDTRSSILSCDFDINDYISETNIGDTSDNSVFEAEEEFSEEALDKDEEPRTSTFTAPVLTNSVSQTIETELFDSGTSRHMSPYQHKFINYFPIQKQVLTTADGGTFDAMGKGDMHLMLLNGKSTTKILLKDVLYAPKMGLMLISIGKIDIAGFASLFHKGNLTIFSCGKEKKKLVTIPLKNGLYCVEHEEEVATVVKEELVTIKKLHHLMGHISLEAAKALVQKGLVEGIKLDEASKILSCNSCEYGKAHHKEIKKERQFP